MHNTKITLSYLQSIISSSPVEIHLFFPSRSIVSFSHSRRRKRLQRTEIQNLQDVNSCTRSTTCMFLICVSFLFISSKFLICFLCYQKINKGWFRLLIWMVRFKKKSYGDEHWVFKKYLFINLDLSNFRIFFLLLSKKQIRLI